MHDVTHRRNSSGNERYGRGERNLEDRRKAKIDCKGQTGADQTSNKEKTTVIVESKGDFENYDDEEAGGNGDGVMGEDEDEASGEEVSENEN